MPPRKSAYNSCCMVTRMGNDAAAFIIFMRLSELKGIGPKTEELFLKLGVDSVEKLFSYYPLHYDQYTEPESVNMLSPGKKSAVAVTISSYVNVIKKGRLTICTLDADDGTGRIRLVWFNAPYVRGVLKRGMEFIFRGNVSEKKGTLQMEHPEIYTRPQYQEKISTLAPVYGLTKGLSNNAVIKAVKCAFETAESPCEYLPEQFAAMSGLQDEALAVRDIHFPENQEVMTRARSRLAFDEFFRFILAIRMLRAAEEGSRSAYVIPKIWETENVIDHLPFYLTGGQMNVWREIENDLSGGRCMTRLIQGDVGSGKTILAFLAMIMTAFAGYQSVLMAPTEVLARQHYEKMKDLIGSQDLTAVKPVLLTGSLKAAERRAALYEIGSGGANVIIGTHALIQESVDYKELALVITDEQHRFGVYQRQTLAGRGMPPHMMVMSATPIPRTLGLIFYGDLDISVLDELPAKRLPIKNCVVDPSFRPNAMRFIKRELEAGHQAYIICPMIEAAEGLEAENVLDYTAKMKKEFPGWTVAALHGRMQNAEKNKVMDAFSEGKIHLLVSTTVVEVGVDVPNATVMMIENAERFGLAALHQLRGRVGRGSAQSYCIFMAGQQSKAIKERLEILNRSNNGFEIAAKDFELRGPGDLLGIRQSGDMYFNIADLSRDADMLKLAGEMAAVVMQDDPGLVSEEFSVLREDMRRYMEGVDPTTSL